ncbi:proline-rich transmembrane protein 1-like [Cololabis saira]|uniref:proline-rich transmembrane protein 1-like n=1 Tax=Cololabis saira TaxID=129043 RepID=UPI002AD3ED31|nr:proline-rich transmembrane protein 1-like [Cololabis saira]
MDPNKSASAPPMGWTDEKSSLAQPPPYQEQPYPGPQHPGPGYPTQPGYGYPPQYGAGYEPQQQQPYGMGQPYPPQSAVTVQPTVYVTQSPLENPVDDYMCYSIFTMLCCCLPLGIAALIHSISAREANYTGNQLAAERNSRMARTLNHVALGLGIGALVLMIVYVVVVVAMV